MLKWAVRDEPEGSLGLSSGAIEWLQNAYLPDRLAFGIGLVRFERTKRGYGYNTDWYKTATMLATDGSNIDLTVDVVLHPDAWVDVFGRGVLGLFWPPATAWSRPKLETAWHQDFNLGYGVTEHESVHMLEYYDSSSPTWWDDWQHSLHGLSSLDSNKKLRDPYCIAVNKVILEGFKVPVEHSYHPGLLPCAVKALAQAYSMTKEGSRMLSKINLFDDGQLEVFDGNGQRVAELEVSVRECAQDLVRETSTTTILVYTHRRSGASSELSKGQFMDRLLLFM